MAPAIPTTIHHSPPHPVRAPKPPPGFNPRAPRPNPGAQNGGPLAGLGHALRGAVHGAGALGNEFFAKPVEYSYELARGRRQQAQRTRKEMQTFSETFAKGLAPQSAIDIAHGHAPSGSHLGMDALFFLPWSRGARALGEGAHAAAVAEDAARASEAASRASESFKAGRGLGDAALQGAKRLRPSERALRASPARKELFNHLDSTMEPGAAKAQKQLFDKTVKAAARNTGQSVHDVIGNLIHVRSHVEPHELPQELKGLYQHEPIAVPHLPDSIDAKGIAKEIHASHGHLLPNSLRKPGALERAINRTYEHVKLGAPYRDWYKRYAGVIHSVAASARLNHVSPRQLAQLISVYSQRAMPTENLRRAIESALNNGDFGYFHGQAEKAKKILADPTWYEREYLPSKAGPKVSNYYLNALEHLDPAHYAELTAGKPSPVTIDTHMNQMLAGQDRIPDRQYESLAEVFRRIAPHVGMSPSEVQAASWVSKKAANEAENTALKQIAKGNKGFVQRPAAEYLHSAGDAYERAHEKYAGTLFQQEEHSLPNDTFNPRVAQVTSEANPDPKLWPEMRASYNRLAPEQKVAYGQAMDHAVAGRFEHVLGLDHLGNREGLGIWRGVGEHGVASHLLIGPGPITPELRQDMEALTAAQGIAKHQNSVSWGRPVPPAEGDFHGIHWTPPAGTDPVSASAALDKIAGDGNVGFIHAPDGGFYVINFSGEKGADFAIRRLGGDQTDIGWQGGYTIDKRIATPADEAAGAKTFQDAINSHPKSNQLWHELAQVRATTEPIQAHFLGTSAAKIVSHEEAQQLAEAGTHVFHGTSPMSAEQIMAERTLRAEQPRAGLVEERPSAWTAQNPDVAQFYRDTAGGGGQEPAIVAIPRERIPEGQGNATHPFGNYGSPDDILFQQAADSYAHMTTDELHAAATQLEQRYNDLLDKLATAQGRPGDYKRVTAYQNAVSRKLTRKGVPYRTVTQQLRDQAENKLIATLERHPEHPLVQQLERESTQAYALRSEIARRNDTLFQGKISDALDAIARYGHRQPSPVEPGEDWYAHANPQATGTDKLSRDVARGIGHLTGRGEPFESAGARERLFSHLDRNLSPGQASLHKDLFDSRLQQAIAEGEHPAQAEARLAAVHAGLLQRAGGDIKGAFEPGVHGAIIHLTDKADVTTFPHELGHFLRRYGLNAEHEARLAEWAGVKNGVWDRSAEEKFAGGLEKMIRQGDAPNNLVEEFKRLSPLFREVYPEASKLPTVPADVAQVYKEILGHRDGVQALYWTLHNKLVDSALANEARQGPRRSPEEAKQHVLEANRLAEERGHGRVFPPTITHKEGEFSPETGGVAGHEVRVGMRDVPQLRSEQEAVREVQRYRKAGDLRDAQRAALSSEHPSDALTAAGGARAGALEHGDFKGFENLHGYMDELATHVINFENMLPHDKQNAWDAIVNGLEGQVPRKFEQKLLEKLFGKEAESLSQQLKSGTFGEKLANVFNIPRALMASGDLSAPFRQGLMLLAHRPGTFFKNYGPMFKDTFSEANFHETMQGIREMPTHALSEQAGVAYTQAGAKISQREEQFASNMAEHLHELPGVRSVPGVKHVAQGASAVVRGSDRGYVAFLDKSRADSFDELVHMAAEEGYHLTGPHGEKLLSDIAKFVNSATGRGDLGKLADHAATLNTLFFSPRLLKSRLDFLNPLWYMRMEPFARRQALRSAVRLAGTLSTVLMFAKFAGATVVTDPRNADFGKIRIGNTRLDIAGGFTQPIRLISQLYTGQIVSSQTGRLENLTGSGFGSSRLDVTSQFLENKFAPVPGTIVDLLRGSQFGGQPISAKSEVYQHMVPLLWQDMHDIYHSTGAKGLIGYSIPDLFGVGVQNYGAPGPKTRKDTSKLEQQSQQAGLGKPPAAVQNDVQWKAKLDANTYAGMSPYQRAEAAVKLYDERYHTTLEKTILPHLQTQGQAEALYREVRSRLFPSLDRWQSAINKKLGAQESQKPVPQPAEKHTSSAPALPVVSNAQETAYHIPATGGRAGATESPAPPPGSRQLAVHGQHTQYIAQQAQAHGLDPQAVLAVASQEGLSGAVGDHGTSFGPFQLHEGGALPAEVAARGAQYAQQWAWSPAGINYALSRMAGVARGLHGQAAVSAIVRGFERPANPGAEIAGAMGAYGGSFSSGGPQSFGGAGGLVPGPGTSGQSDLANAADVVLESLASGNYNPIRVFTALSNQPLQNTMEMPGFGHVRFQIPKLQGPVGRAARGAIALAEAYLGTPYVYGGESPRGFDCSGLLQYIYAKQGVNIPRTSEEQWRAGQRVAKSQLRPGDAVFFTGSDGSRNNPGHVGIYIGHGKFIEAPHTGATVRISNLAGYPGYVGARRYAKSGRRAA